MMDAMELVQKLAQSQVVRCEIPMQMQLGLPYLEKQNGKLCICFEPHREEYVNGNIDIYAQQYEIAWVYPFEHLALFRDLTLERTVDASKPLCSISEKQMLSVGAYMMKELYQECTRVLTFQENDGNVTEVMLKSYQRKYYKTVETLGLEDLYGHK